MRHNNLHISSASFWSPDELTASSWLSHAPFAFWLTQATRPRRFVELGTRSGFSFFAVCQAIARLGLETGAVAVDTAKGDEHPRSSGEEPFARAGERNAAYRGFATFLRATVDEALTHFDDGSVDLLHIHGRHLGHDIERIVDLWLPKLAHDAVVLVHGTQERDRDSGVGTLWDKLSARYPSFEFTHGGGLGILCPGTTVPEGLRDLTQAAGEVRDATRRAYETLGSAIEERWQGEALRRSLDVPTPPDADPSVSRAAEMLATARQAVADAEAERDLHRASCWAARRDLAAIERALAAAEAARADAEARSADLAAREAGIGIALRRAETTARLMRLSLLAKRAEVERLGRDGNDCDVQSDLLIAAFGGEARRMERERDAIHDRAEELLRWAQGRKVRLDALLARLDREVEARVHAEGRLDTLERSRLVRAARKIQRLLGRPAPDVHAPPVAAADGDRQVEALRNTGLFDESYYLEANPDLAERGIDAAAHFAGTGWWEGRQPNPTFDPGFYLAENPDVAEAGHNPLIHYAAVGILEGRRPSRAIHPSRWIRPLGDPLDPDDEAVVEAVLDTGLFDESYYRATNADILEGAVEPVVHFALHGWKEGRRPNPHFDPAFYLESNTDVAASGENPLVHYATRGILERRAPSREGLRRPGGEAAGDADRRLADEVVATGLFDAGYYRATYPDIAGADMDPALHFVRDGWKEGRKPNPDFDPKFYLEQNPSVAALGINPLLHFAEHGLVGGLPFSPLLGGPGNSPHSTDDYARWIELYDTLTEGDRRAIRARLTRLTYKPLISVVVPVYNTPVDFLRQAIASVQGQLYPNWELCIADDASPTSAVREVLREMAEADPRIKVVERAENGHISAASNSALALATGEFVALMDHDDILPAHALFEVVACLNENPNLDLIYSDEDHIDQHGKRTNPYFKSDFNPDLLLGQNVISHLGVYRRSLIDGIGGFRLGYEGSQDYDLALRVVDASSLERIHHIPAVLYHWRSDTGSATFSESAMQRCIASARRALADHLERRRQAGEVVAHPVLPLWQRIRRPRPDPAPLVSVIVPTKDRADILRPCVEGLLDRTDYSNLEVLVVDHQSTEPSALQLLDELAQSDRVRVLPHEGPFNYSAINNAAVAQARGPVLALLNNDIDVIDADWLDEMVALAVLPEVGAVGAKLLYPDDRVQHAGVILGAGGVAGHFFHQARAEDAGYFGRAALTSAMAAVTAACLVVRRSVFDEAGGFDEVNLPIAFNDVDLCLKIQQRGYRNVWTPHARLYHHESASRGSDLEGERLEHFKREVEFMREKWGDVLDADPSYNPNLSLDSADFRLAFPPRRRKPWHAADIVP